MSTIRQRNNNSVNNVLHKSLLYKSFKSVNNSRQNTRIDSKYQDYISFPQSNSTSHRATLTKLRSRGNKSLYANASVSVGCKSFVNNIENNLCSVKLHNTILAQHTKGQKKNMSMSLNKNKKHSLNTINFQSTLKQLSKLRNVKKDVYLNDLAKYSKELSELKLPNEENYEGRKNADFQSLIRTKQDELGVIDKNPVYFVRRSPNSSGNLLINRNNNRDMNENINYYSIVDYDINDHTKYKRFHYRNGGVLPSFAKSVGQNCELPLIVNIEKEKYLKILTNTYIKSKL